MSPPDRRIAKGEWVLVTGANGYIASHIVDVLLAEGYNVRGTVRSDKPWLNQFFEAKYGKGRFETGIVKDLQDEAGFESVMIGISGVIHTAADVSFSPEASQVVPAAVADTWNIAAINGAYDPQTPEVARGFLVYAASKTAGEKALWKYVQDNTLDFSVNTVIPNYTIGPILHPEIKGSSMAVVRALLEGHDQWVKLIPPQYYGDVRDTARVHVAALLDPAVQNQRLFSMAKEFNWTDIIETLRQIHPNNQKIPDPPANEGRDLSDFSQASRKAQELLGSFFGQSHWKSLEESLRDGTSN